MPTPSTQNTPHTPWLRRACLAAVLLALTACTTTGTTVKMPSSNYNSRVSMVVIHHTAGNFKSSAYVLTKPTSRPVSSHYLVPEPNDESYKHKRLKVFELVPETGRAWHAGNSYWAGKSALNDHSIGIEVVNQTHCKRADPSLKNPPKWICFYPDFAENQIDILIDLLHGILERHPRISPTNVIAHSDIAPGRKIDPGPRFPWQRLYQVGIGAWFDDKTVIKYWERFTKTPMPLINVQKALHAYGYKIEATGVLDEQTRNVLQSFQLHFRPMELTGEPSLETNAILFALIEKYRPNELDALLTVNASTHYASP